MYALVIVDLHSMSLLLKIIQSAASRGCVHQNVTSAGITSFASRFFCEQRHILTSAQKLPTSASRLFSRQMPRGPRLTLDAEKLSAVITEDIAIYTYRNNTFFLLLTIFGGLQFFCWANFAMFVKSDQTAENLVKQDVTARKDHSSWMTKFYADNRTKIAAATLSLGKQVFLQLFMGDICVICYYRLRGGYVFVVVCLSVC